MYTLIDHLGYTVWATTKLSQILEKADDSLLRRPIPSSFPSIEKTILHIWDAEIAWLKRLHGISITEWPSKNFAGDKQALLSGWLQSGVEFKEYMEAQGPEYLQKQIDYRNTAGKPFSNTVEEIIYHVVNHGTFHRGQIVTMLRAGGWAEKPENEVLTSTDLVTYLRETRP